ncbi:hypothetical protein M885DRAFT_404061, partial [Pelagophyceae sp. CCMP2097]
FVSVVLPSVVNTGDRGGRLEAIAATWGPAARAIFVGHANWDAAAAAAGYGAFSAASDCSGAYPQALVLPAAVGPARGDARLRHVLRAVASAPAFDFVFLCNDHTAVVSQNLDCYLRGLDAAEPLYRGRALQQRGGKRDDVFNSGAAGYVLSRAALTLLLGAWARREPGCAAPEGAAWLQGNPGLVLARCLAGLGVV